MVSGAVEDDRYEELAKLLATLIRLHLPTQAEAIRELDKVGFGPKRISELLGTSPNTVNVTLNKAKKENGR